MATHQFTRFPNLSAEIRIMIWRKSIEPRLVEVWPKGGKYDGFCSSTPLPGAMTACRESRATVIRFYSLVFGGTFIQARIRFNFALDTLYIDWKIQERLASFVLSISEYEAGRIRSIFIDGEIRYARYCNGLEVDMGMLRRNPAMRHGISTDYNSEKVGDDEFQLLSSALSSMPMLVKLYVVYTVKPEGDEAPLDNHDEFSQLIIFKYDELLDSFPAPSNAEDDYRVSLNDEIEPISFDWLLNNISVRFNQYQIRHLDIRYAWRFPTFFTTPPSGFSSPGFQERIAWWREHRDSGYFLLEEE
ncbi:predicted protein [Sclerotinia sclerotiorum 1980 UF-70]|uniref:2EXR domain-containing protein n=2 Tax=Sclerotinia sclerotiorum (strain ATCC 18683 / 1980 / Ss-1) TaxID=665079 RepID=A7F6J9_SCLS1|nr:predicted protein [Sclerotinia sclerotiorum 1980 UF-70]APA08306.1 hypothetical protein sscle_03g030760 [Sclerotinia sclerotiorum 1980 UF-70]EDN98370.1 predicted protein [Sclerotinia sclerotiorum 1980 UF-70]